MKHSYFYNGNTYTKKDSLCIEIGPRCWLAPDLFQHITCNCHSMYIFQLSCLYNVYHCFGDILSYCDVIAVTLLLALFLSLDFYICVLLIFMFSCCQGWDVVPLQTADCGRCDKVFFSLQCLIWFLCIHCSGSAGTGHLVFFMSPLLAVTTHLSFIFATRCHFCTVSLNHH